MPTIISRLQSLLKQTNRYKQRVIKSLLKTMRKIEVERKERTADLDEAARIIAKQLADLGWTGKPSKGTKRKGTAVKSSGKKRVRRSTEQLKDEAVKVVALIRSAGKDGIKGGDIRAKYPGVGQNIRAWVKQYTGETLKTTGKRSAMRYSHG